MFALFGCDDGKKEDQKEAAKTQDTVMNDVVKDDNGAPIILISPEEAKKLMQLESTQLVDVRTAEELQNGRIKGALNMVYQKNFKEKIASLDKTKPIIVYCRTGRRSALCADILKEAGFEKIYDLDGGITQWIKEGKPVVK